MNDKKKKDPGDNELMLKARESFLCKGYYDELCNSIKDIVKRKFASAINILDAGCGTGYYLRNIVKEIDCKSSCGVYF